MLWSFVFHLILRFFLNIMSEKRYNKNYKEMITLLLFCILIDY